MRESGKFSHFHTLQKKSSHEKTLKNNKFSHDTLHAINSLVCAA